MKWKISWLKSQPNQEYHVAETLMFDQKMFKNVSNIQGVSDIKVNGVIFMNNDLVNVDLTFVGTLYLPCANTNEIGDYDFSFVINEILNDESDGIVNYSADFIDLYELIWQTIVIEAPTKFVKNKPINKSGKSWRLMSEDEYQSKKDDEIDPRLEKLKDLFNEKEE